MSESAIPSSMTVPRFLPGGQIDFVEKPVPRPGPGELLLRVRANALCRSELGQYRSGTYVTLGHETVGVVAAVGPDTSTPVGTLGAVFLMDYCADREADHVPPGGGRRDSRGGGEA